MVPVCCSQALSLRKGEGEREHCGGDTASPGESREGAGDRFSLLSRQLALCNYEIHFFSFLIMLK